MNDLWHFVVRKIVKYFLRLRVNVRSLLYPNEFSKFDYLDHDNMHLWGRYYAIAENLCADEGE